MNNDEDRIEPQPTENININIVITVRQRADGYQEQISAIADFVKEQFPELKSNHMNSPLMIRIKIK